MIYPISNEFQALRKQPPPFATVPNGMVQNTQPTFKLLVNLEFTQVDRG